MVKPILFNTEMVRAILQDRKVVTRRVVKGPVPDGAVWGLRRFTHQDRAFCHFEVGGELFGRYFKLPYCVGDTLYVRETWCNANEPGIEPDYHYFADTCEDYDQTECTWRPSIHMPKDAEEYGWAANPWVWVVRFERCGKPGREG